MATLVSDLGLVLAEGFTQIGNVFGLFTSNPILLFPLGLTVFGIVMKYGKGMIRL